MSCYWKQEDYFVYFAETVSGNPEIKIGYSWKPSLRMTQLRRQKGQDLRLIGQLKYESRWQAFQAEQELLWKCREFHLKGEWFHRDPQLISFLMGLVQGGV